MSNLILESALTCPQCGFVAVETMPTDACIYFYECTCCHTLLRPKTGDCCVFCSFGSVKCPPIQLTGGCCTGGQDQPTAESSLKRVESAGRKTK